MEVELSDFNSEEVSLQTQKGIVKVWCDGCFDLMHYGHANALRQAKQSGDFLIAGVHSNEEISKNKGPPVLTLEERVDLVKSVKWVDHVVINAPYVPSVMTLDKYGCQICVHGDDIAVSAEGIDAYGEIKAAGRYRYCKRTAGVSTTDLVGRMLSACGTTNEIGYSAKESPWTTMGEFLLTSQRIAQFSSNKEPKPTDKVIYVPGAFDCFHVGHVKFLQSVRKYGDYVIVGLFLDETIRKYKNEKLSIMALYERLLCVMACKYVDNVIIGAPYVVTSNILDSFKVDLVCHGSSSVSSDIDGAIDPFKEAKRRGIFKIVDSGSSITIQDIVNRIRKNQQLYVKRNQDKVKKEVARHKIWQNLQESENSNG